MEKVGNFICNVTLVFTGSRLPISDTR